MLHFIDEQEKNCWKFCFIQYIYLQKEFTKNKQSLMSVNVFFSSNVYLFWTNKGKVLEIFVQKEQHNCLSALEHVKTSNKEKKTIITK